MNIILSTDAYKFSHPFMVDSSVEALSSYIEARGSKSYPDDEIVFFGLQAFIRKYLSKPITREDVDQAELIAASALIPFRREMWDYIVDHHNGFLPIKIQALPEGTCVKHGIPVVQVSSECKFPAIASVIETALLRAIWYPSSVATLSREIKKNLIKALKKSSTKDPNGLIGTMLNDFGARGCSSGETAELGGMAHLINFIGSDTIEAIMGAVNFYDHNLKRDGSVLISVPATEHSVTTIHGPDLESAFVTNVIDTFTKLAFPIVSIVADSYDLDNFVDNIIGKDNKNKILNRSGFVVVRPDSGDPVVIVPRVLEKLWHAFGGVENDKGFRVLDDHIRVIQGDGVSRESINDILDAIMSAGFSVENVVFGMGGKLLQGPQRDDHSWAMKTNAAKENGQWFDVQKKPATDMSKASKAGKQAVVNVSGNLLVIREDMLPTPDTASHGVHNMLETVWDCGKVIRTQTFNEIRKNAEIK